MDWEVIDDLHSRTKVFSGWLVKAFSEVNEDVYGDGSLQSGYTWRISMCFVPDPKHEWKIEE